MIKRLNLKVVFITIFIVVLITIFIIGNSLFRTDAFVNNNAQNNGDAYIKKDLNVNYGSSSKLNIYGKPTDMIAIMNWTLPKGTGAITKIALTIYCEQNGKDPFPTNPVELHILNNDFSEMQASWYENETGSNWTNHNIWKAINSKIIDSVMVNTNGFYTWIIKSDGLNLLTWGDNFQIALMLPGQTGYKGVDCLSKENTYFKPYITITNEDTVIPTLSNIIVYKKRKTSALVHYDSDIAVNTRIRYSTNSSNLNYWSDFDYNTSYIMLARLSPNTTYYYSVYSYNYIDSNYFVNSSIMNFTTYADSVHIPLVTFVFDDGLNSTYTRVLPILNRYKFPAVTSIISGKVGKYDNKYYDFMTYDELRTLQNTYNWEIASHSVTHDINKIDNKDLEYEFNGSKNDLILNGLNIHNFIAPGGVHNNHTEIFAIRYYDSDRTISGGLNEPPYFEYPLNAVSIWNKTSELEAEQLVDNAISNKSWLIFVFHNIVDYVGQDGGFTSGDWTKKNLIDLSEYIKSKRDIRVVTIHQAQTMNFVNPLTNYLSIGKESLFFLYPFSPFSLHIF